jgi:hypothetical protein
MWRRGSCEEQRRRAAWKSMPWRKRRGAGAAQGHGAAGTQAEMCGGRRGKGRHGDGRSHKPDARQSHSLPDSHCGGQNNGIRHQKWDLASPSPIILVYTPRANRKQFLLERHHCSNTRRKKRLFSLPPPGHAQPGKYSISLRSRLEAKPRSTMMMF